MPPKKTSRCFTFLDRERDFLAYLESMLALKEEIQTMLSTSKVCSDELLDLHLRTVSFIKKPDEDESRLAKMVLEYNALYSSSLKLRAELILFKNTPIPCAIDILDRAKRCQIDKRNTLFEKDSPAFAITEKCSELMVPAIACIDHYYLLMKQLHWKVEKIEADMAICRVELNDLIKHNEVQSSGLAANLSPQPEPAPESEPESVSNIVIDKKEVSFSNHEEKQESVSLQEVEPEEDFTLPGLGFLSPSTPNMSIHSPTFFRRIKLPSYTLLQGELEDKPDLPRPCCTIS